MSKQGDKPSASQPQTAEGRPTHDEIELRAYQLYVERGRADGEDVGDWLQAERELVAKCESTSQKAKAVAV
jgi:Protein of unknown function (DUF2934)